MLFPTSQFLFFLLSFFFLLFVTSGNPNSVSRDLPFSVGSLLYEGLRPNGVFLPRVVNAGFCQNNSIKSIS